MKRILLKCTALFFVVLLLVVALVKVHSVVRDRIKNRDHAVQSVIASLAGQQALMGPVLVQECTRTSAVVKDGKTEYDTHAEHYLLFPEHLQHQAQAEMQVRKRSLHRVNTYSVTDRVTAQFSQVAQWMQSSPPPLHSGQTRHCAPDLRLVLALSDPRGIRQAQLHVNGQDIALAAGASPLKRYKQGLHAVLPQAALADPDVQVALNLTLVGTGRLSFVPLGNSNVVELSANWPHPSFGGSFLPVQREVGDAGFSARWELSALASSARRAFTQGQALCRFAPQAYASYRYRSAGKDDDDAQDCLETQATEFINPVNPHALAERATKYGLLFVLLTFVAVGLVEVLKNLRVHPVQYLLVGAGLSIFFLLLVSLSEHMTFGAAYAIASAACVLLLGYYASHVLGGAGHGAPFAGGIAALYGLLYLLLQLEQSALLVGSVALFVVLAAIMVSTRRVDWYAFGHQDAPPPGAAPLPAPATGDLDKR